MTLFLSRIFLLANNIFVNSNKKFTFNQKLCQTKFVDLIKTNNFSFLLFFISRIIWLKI